MAEPSSLAARVAVALLSCSLLAGACSGGDRGAATPQGGLSSTPTTTTDGAGGTTTNMTESGDALVTPPGEPDTTGARRALDAYLDALAANDFGVALGAADGPAHLLTEVRRIVHAGNRERGGTTTSSFTRRSFDVGAATEAEVRFRGRAQLTSVVSGPGSPSASTTDVLADVVLRLGPGGWLVTDLTYNDRPVLAFAADSAASVGPVRFELAGAVAFGSSLAVVLRVVAVGEHTVDIDSAVIRVGDEEAAATRIVIVSGQPGFVLVTHPRRDQRPGSWRAQVTIDGTSSELVLSF